MEDNQKTQNQAIVIIGLIALIVALVVGIKLLFAGLGAAIGDPVAETSSQSVQIGEPDQIGENEMPAPSFCPHCGDGLPQSFQWGQFCPYCGEKVE